MVFVTGTYAVGCCCCRQVAFGTLVQLMLEGDGVEFNRVLVFNTVSDITLSSAAVAVMCTCAA